MSGYALSQAYGKGALTQQTVHPGQWDGCPPIPATGNYTCKPGTMDVWRLVAITFTLTTDSTAQNRFVQIQYPFATNGMLAFDATGYAQVASKAATYSGSVNSWNNNDTAASPSVNFRLSGLFRTANQALTIAIIDSHTDDALSNISMTFERTLVIPDGSQEAYGVVLDELVT
jgi:hypothetical protein